MSGEDPKVSIITINYNDAKGLEKTINSVRSQTYKNIEYLVIDGGSTDGSRQVIERAEADIDYWVSEPDNGIYNAMNKGIKAASGAYLLFINSGDLLKDENVIKDLSAAGLDADLVYGNLVYEGDIGTWYPKAELTFETFYESTLPHQATFIKKVLFEKVGLYDESLKIAADWAFFLLATCKFNCTYKYLNRDIAWFMDGGISSDPLSTNLIQQERSGILKAHFPFFIADYNRFISIRNEMKQIKYFLKCRKFFKGLFGADKVKK